MLEAEKLAQKDSFLGIRGKSDPYAKVSIGLQHFRSKTIYKNLYPTWNEVFEVRGSLEAPSYSPELHSGSAGPNKMGFCLHGLHIHMGQNHRHGLGDRQTYFPDPLGFRRWPLLVED